MSTILIIGDSSNAANAINRKGTKHQFLPSISGFELRSLNQSKTRDFLVEKINLYRDKVADLVVLYCVGVINVNQANIHEAEFYNSSLPLFLFECAEELKYKIVTFGSVLEVRDDIASRNSYISTKNSLYRNIQKIQSEAHLHLQYHTWFGGRREHPNMFLAEIIKSLATKKKFRMSAGLQYREYHHIEDDMNVMLSNLDLSGIHQITFENAIRLRDLACKIFEYFKLEELLEIDESEIVQVEINEPFRMAMELRNRILPHYAHPLFPSIFEFCSKELNWKSENAF